MSHHIIRRVRIAHCKRGPSRCEQCREMDVKRICLLDISPEGEMQRRVIQVEGVWHEFDIVRIFDSPQEAQHYADDFGIEDAEF